MILKLIGGSQPPKSTFINYPKENYIRLFQIRDYGDSPIPVYIPINKASKITNKGDILIARYGGSLGKVFIAEYGAYNVAMSKVTKLYINDHIDFNFLYFFYKSKIFQEIIRRNSRSAQDGFNSEEINDLLLPLPPLEEQLRIITLLNKLNLLLNKYSLIENELSELEKTFSIKLQKSVLNYAMQGQLVEQSINDNSKDLIEQIYKEKDGLLKQKKIKQNELQKSIIYKNIIDNSYYEKFEDGREEKIEVPFEIPDNWLWIRLGNLANIRAGGTPSRTKTQYWNGNIPWLKISDITTSKKVILRSSEFITKEGVKNSSAKVFNKGTIIYSIFASVGKVAILGIDSAFNQAIVAIDTYSKNIDNFLYMSLLNLDNQINKTKRGSSQFNINQNILKKFLIPLPPLKEQEQIVNKINKINVLIDSMRN
ncbi:hypothetical protein MFERI14815_00291 [Mycoplasma feriruminatoris]|uniref:restriction endonuclease subunit S n=1 Tax=Mycoplasma feriruminatoris TaxID=1179777 RepID=UPI00241DFE00|nr:restriction endonuclease subunit S [Mycoplasma feriruminatoris]WFQ91687.1 hypothetical protein MFERI14815_00291 [Mycoplasma feriruminatoris]